MHTKFNKTLFLLRKVLPLGTYKKQCRGYLIVVVTAERVYFIPATTRLRMWWAGVRIVNSVNTGVIKVSNKKVIFAWLFL